MAIDTEDNESYAVIGAAMKVHSELGCGFLEAVYQEALEIEFKNKNIPYVREKRLPIYYNGQELKTYYQADFVCYDNIIVELKAVEELIPFHTAQVLNYLNITGLQLGLLVNFNARKVVPRRIVRFEDYE